MLGPTPLRPAELQRLPAAFDDDRFIFELKQDGFRALAQVTAGSCELISRRGNVYRAFDPLCRSLSTLGCDTVLDGEVVVLDGAGRSQFYELLRRRGQPVFYAFDCIWLNGRDLRPVPLLERKKILARLTRGHPRVLCASHIEDQGQALFRAVCEQDLEGIVAKRKDGAYGDHWYKIRNPRYSQYEGRRELFERRQN